MYRIVIEDIQMEFKPKTSELLDANTSFTKLKFINQIVKKKKV